MPGRLDAAVPGRAAATPSTASLEAANTQTNAASLEAANTQTNAETQATTPPQGGR